MCIGWSRRNAGPLRKEKQQEAGEGESTKEDAEG